MFGGVGIIDFMGKYGLEFYPPGYMLIPMIFILTAYSIVKHHNLMDINIVIRKGLAYSILITIFTIIYLGIVIVIEKFFQGILGYRSVLISLLFASIIALIFIPLKNKIQSLIDRVFLGKTPAQIARENELLRQELMRSEKLKAVAVFASGMAHEIKNPLTAIKTFTEFLPKEANNKQFMEKYSEIVGSEVNRIDDLVHQLLDFSKPQPLQLKETDINKLIDDTLDILSSQFIKSHINVSKDYKFNINEGKINIDSQKMRQVFMNLFINSIEAMPHGGTLTVSTSIQDPASSIKPVGVEQLTGAKFVLISIQDTGCGISEKDLPHIFEPFYSTKEKGSGLGLSIVYNIIKEHKGRIAVDSKINQGTKFIIDLPQA
jgi:signal transduction histidine kinase